MLILNTGPWHPVPYGMLGLALQHEDQLGPGVLRWHGESSWLPMPPSTLTRITLLLVSGHVGRPTCKRVALLPCIRRLPVRVTPNDTRVRSVAGSKLPCRLHIGAGAVDWRRQPKQRLEPGVDCIYLFTFFTSLAVWFRQELASESGMPFVKLTPNLPPSCAPQCP